MDRTAAPLTVAHYSAPAAGHAISLHRDAPHVLGSRVDAVDWDEALRRVALWATQRESRYVVACNVHSVVTADSTPALRSAINNADLVVADGAPVAWLMRKLGRSQQQRISGPDLMWRYFAQAAQRGEAVFLYGSTPATLERLVERICDEFPGLRVAGTYSPPFRPLTPQEDAEIVRRINDSGAQTVWVALGCPKQEIWMAEHRPAIRAVQIGVGAAFAFHAGTARRAPGWMQRNGLEWLHRLCCEPRRLARRYVVTNTLFIIGAAALLLGAR